MLTTADYIINRFLDGKEKEYKEAPHKVVKHGAILPGDTKHTFFVLFPNDEFLLVMPGGNKVNDKFFPIRERQVLVRHFRGGA